MPNSSSDPESLSQAPPPDDQRPPGDDDFPRPLRINSIYPIGGALAGGIDVTLTGTGFQPGAEVFFGDSQSPEVIVESTNRVTAKLPPATQTGTVSVTLVNPDGMSATLQGGFTYVTTEGSLHAEVLGVTPLAVIEDTESQVTIRGRNLIGAFNDGIVALRGPSRVHITSSNFGSSRDEATGIELLTLTVRVTATPPLEQHERMAIQVLASLRPGAAGDGLFESSRQMFTVLPRAVPVALAFTANLDPNKPNLVIVAGRNLEGCSLDLGQGATVHLQRSDDQTLAGIVSFAEGAPVPEAAQLKLLDPVGSEAGRFDMTVNPTAESNLSSKSLSEAMSSETPGGGDIGLTLTPVPGQQLVGPTEEDSAVFSLSGDSLFPSFGFDNFEITIRQFTIIIPLFNEVRLIPFFDNGVGDVLNDTPVRAEVGKLFALRGRGLLVALRVELVIHVSIVLIIGFRFGFSPFGFFNEFPDDFPFAIGSIVISFRIRILVFLLISFLVALVKADGSLRTLFFFNLALGFDLIISPDGKRLFDGKFFHKVNHTRIGPRRTSMFPCDGRFQLAEENGQTEFTDAAGGSVSFYFPRAAGQCCLPWDFDLELVRFEEGRPEETIQGSFRTEFCLNAMAGENQIKVIIVSTRTPEGYPPPLRLDVGEIDTLTALGQPVDANGDPIPGSERFDLSTTGRVEFYLESPTNDLLNRDELTPGNAIAEEPGENIIRAKVTTSRVVDLPPGEEPPEFSFWPGDVLGFDILSFLARGLMPAVRTGNLPVIVKALPIGTISVALTMAYYDAIDNNTLKEVRNLTLERNEPFESQQEYVLAARITMNQVQLPLTLKVTSKNPQMSSPLAGLGFGNPREAAATPKQFFDGELVNDSSSGSSLSFTVTTGMLSKLVAIGPQEPPGGARLKIIPHKQEEADSSGTKYVPPGRAVSGRDTRVTIDFDVQAPAGSGATVQVANSTLTLTVGNDETFEEYLRVFLEVQQIMNRSTLKSFAGAFNTALAAQDDLGKINTEVEKRGKTLWTDALAEVQKPAARKDDRPLYWTRLLCLAAIRASFRHKMPASLSDDTIHKFEWPSRGLDSDGRLALEASLIGSRVLVVTGFDPFGLPSRPDQSNPSGLIALEFNKGTAGSSEPAVQIRSAIVPVRYRDFDQGLIELMLKTRLSSIFMLITCSDNSGANYYDVERWAARNRVISRDNENKMPQQLPVAPGHEFEQSTLPYALVITSNQSKLPGPKGVAEFVIDQSYRVAGETEKIEVNREPPIKLPPHRVMARPGDFRPEPLLDDVDEAAFKKVLDGPDASKNSDLGSGGSYLSNEIFYRVCRLRNDFAPSLKSGHFHIPSTDTDPETKGVALIAGVREALRLFVDALASVQPKITSFHPASVRPGGTVTIFGEHFDGVTEVLVGPDAVSHFVVVSPTQIDADITVEETGFIAVVTPYGTATSATMLIVIRRPPREDLGPQLAARRAELGLSNRDAATRLGASAGTYRRWERDLDRPSARFHAAVVAFLGHDPEPSPQELGQIIRAARESDGLTRSQLAERLGVSSSTVKAWETGSVSRPSPRVSGIFENYLDAA